MPIPGSGIGVPGPGGCTWLQGGTWSRGVPGPREVHLVLGGVSGPWGCTLSGGVPAKVLPRCGQTDTCKNITFANFVCGQ